MRYLLICVLGMCLCGCATVKGNVSLARDDKGEITNVKYDAKGLIDFKITKDEVEVMTRKRPKPNVLDKIMDLTTVGFANRVKNHEADKD